MGTVNLVKRNRYQDSVTLMQAAVRLREVAGIDDASLMMGTEPNKEILLEAGLLEGEGRGAGPNDLIVALQGSEGGIAEASERLEAIMNEGITSTDGKGERTAVHSLIDGLAAMPSANLVLISTPGIYAAAEARKALMSGRHVMIFSDNVSLEDEIALKKMASERGLMVMGPDCGTAIIGGVPLGFANAVRTGSIGVVGASGTGMQEITTLVDRHGSGISHAIGTGSRDLSAPVGAISTLAGLAALQNDPQTKVIVVVSKPPDEEVAARVIEAAGKGGKPTVIAFLGMEERDTGSEQVVMAETLEEAAIKAVAWAKREVEIAAGRPGSSEIHIIGSSMSFGTKRTGWSTSGAYPAAPPAKGYIRGLFSGGTFCYEAMLILQKSLGPIYSNAPLSPEQKLTPKELHGRIQDRHVCLDLGADEFTVGRPHPMIDMTGRIERILIEANDPEVAVILMDIVLGYGAHPDPAGALIPTIGQAFARARDDGRALSVIVSICGTDRDSQGYTLQRDTLEAVGVLIASSNANAARLASSLVSPNPGL